VSVEKAIHDVAEEVAAANPRRSIKVEARGGESVDWDCSRIRQPIANLLSNAVEHGAPGRNVTVKAEGNEREVNITVHNQGSPLTPDQLDGIFGSMKGAQSRSPEPASGPLGHLGPGLHIAERIVHAHGGTIRVESTESDGTSFVLSLPRRANDGGSGGPANA
jgi:signal transduction histidine kinase